MKVVVTGGAGFIGSHVVDRLLADEHAVVVLDNFSTGHSGNLEHVAGEIDIINCDISHWGSWTNAIRGVDWVIHLAALADIVPSIQNPQSYFESNVNGTFNMLEAAKANKVKRFIYSGSSSCYGIPNIYPTPETAEIDPHYPYALTKRLGEELVIHWGKIYKLPVISLRFFNVYGPRSRTSGTYGAVFGVFLAQKLANKPMTIVGDGEQTRDFTFVTDVADAIVTAVQSNVSNEIINVGSGTTTSVNELVRLLGGESTHIPKRPGEPDCTFADITKISKLFDWQPKISINKGIETVLENINYWASAPVWTPDTIATATKEWFEFLGDENEKI